MCKGETGSSGTSSSLSAGDVEKIVNEKLEAERAEAKQREDELVRKLEKTQRKLARAKRTSDGGSAKKKKVDEDEGDEQEDIVDV